MSLITRIKAIIPTLGKGSKKTTTITESEIYDLELSDEIKEPGRQDEASDDLEDKEADCGDVSI